MSRPHLTPTWDKMEKKGKKDNYDVGYDDPTRS